jgi:hypothetical protein
MARSFSGNFPPNVAVVQLKRRALMDSIAVAFVDAAA